MCLVTLLGGPDPRLVILTHEMMHNTVCDVVSLYEHQLSHAVECDAAPSSTNHLNEWQLP